MNTAILPDLTPEERAALGVAVRTVRAWGERVRANRRRPTLKRLMRAEECRA
jgi:hypothetical protein